MNRTQGQMHTLRGKVRGNSNPFNANQFEFTGHVTGTKIGPRDYIFLTNTNCLHKGTWSPEIVRGTSPGELSP